VEHAAPYFDIYDFFGYLLPGSIIYGTLIYYGYTFNIVESSITYLLTHAVYGPIIFLFSSYLLGQTIQIMGSFTEQHFIYCKNWLWEKEYPSKSLVSDDEKRCYKEDFKKELKEKINNFFGLSTEVPDQTKFELCYTLTIQKGIGKRVEKFLSMSSLYRGLFISFLITSIVATLSIIQLGVYFNYCYIPVSFCVITILFLMRYLYFGKRFADAVYRDFFVYVVLLEKSKTESVK